MRLAMLVCAALFAAGSIGCASAPQFVRSPGYMTQPVGRAVVGQCYVDGDVLTIRHAFQLDRPGQLAVRTDVKTGTLNAEILIKDPSGAYVQHMVTSPAQRSYAMNLPAGRGAWEVVVVCRRGTASYTVEAKLDPPVTLGAAR